MVNVTGNRIGIKVNVTGIRNGIGIIEFAKHWNRSELESESRDAGIGIRIGIKNFGQRWNRNQNRNHLLLESELESAFVELESVKKKEQINVGRGCPAAVA